MNNLDTKTFDDVQGSVSMLASRGAHSADAALKATQRAAGEAVDTLSAGLDQLRHAVPSAFSRAADEADAMARRSTESARRVAAAARDRAERMGHATADHIRDEPLKSVLIAMAAGAAAAAVFGWLLRPRQPRD